VYNNGGQDEAERFIVEKLPGLMYNNGKGQVINRNDYLRWKFQNRKHVSILSNMYILAAIYSTYIPNTITNHYITVQLFTCGRHQQIICKK